MALIDLKTNLAEGIGGTNTDDGTFKVKQGDNTERTSEFTKLPRPEIDTDTLPPEIKGREQALQAVKDVGVEKTALFVGKQIGLHKLNANEDTRNYDPTSLVKNLGVKTDNIVGGDIQDGSEVVNQGIKFDKPSTSIFLGVNRFNDKNKRPSRRLGVVIDDKKSYGLSSKMYYEDNKEEIFNSGFPRDFIKFYINDPIGKRLINFPAYLNDITDNSSGEYNPTRYIGRADQVYVYSGYSRNISFGFKVAALTRGDIPLMWKKIEAIKSLTLPAYQDNVIQNDNEPRPVAPFVELTIGDLYKDQPGYFSSVNITIPQNSNWETEDGYQLTHLCDVSVEFTFIGKKLPNLLGKQFDIDGVDFDIIEKGQAEALKKSTEEIISERKRENLIKIQNNIPETYKTSNLNLTADGNDALQRDLRRQLREDETRTAFNDISIPFSSRG